MVTYLADLSRFADVYYLADCELAPGQLEKLALHTKGAWGIRHGRYDFGSYSMLAKDLVGWNVLDTYDEVMFANDSCFLVQPLDQVFAKMDATTCDWWGLQATYDHFDDRAFEQLGRRLGLDEVGEQMRELALWRYSDFIHVGSYFLCYRRRVHTDPRFRRRLDEVASQSEKVTIILKYEIGFSRLLILAGFTLATFVDGIFAYHPVYRASAFDLMHEGFPLLKRQLLTENPFKTPDLHRWKERVLEAAPEADVDAIERSTRRTAPPWSLARSFGFRSRRDGTVQPPGHVGPDEFADEDRWVPEHDHWWVFPVDPRTGVMSGELRGVFEAVRQDPSVKKIVLSGSRIVKYGGENVDAVPVESAPGQMFGLRARTLFITVGLAATSTTRWPVATTGSSTRPTTGPGAGRSSPRGPGRRASADRRRPTTPGSRVSSSRRRRQRGRGAFPPRPGGRVGAGSPRIDLLVRDEAALWRELHSQLIAAARPCWTGDAWSRCRRPRRRAGPGRLRGLGPRA